MTNPSEELFVDTTGMRTGAENFTTKGDEITSITGEISTLLDPATLLAAVGNNKYGPGFAQGFTTLGQQLHDGVKGWGTAVRSTGTTVTDLARTFEDGEAGATEASRTLGTVLHDSIVQLNTPTTGGGGGALPPPVDGGGSTPHIPGGAGHHG